MKHSPAARNFLFALRERPGLSGTARSKLCSSKLLRLKKASRKAGLAHWPPLKGMVSAGDCEPERGC